jgi:hypothetical protein
MAPEKFSGLETTLAQLAIECEPKGSIRRDGRCVHRDGDGQAVTL